MTLANLVVADMAEEEIMMTDGEDMEAVGTTIVAIGEKEAIVMMTEAMLLVELIAIAVMIVMVTVMIAVEVDITTAMTGVVTEVVTEVEIGMEEDLARLRLPLLMATQLPVERVGNHMLEVEDTMMTDVVMNIDC
jgi:hypothetical protein